ncbi:MAG TPA: PilZ domain-containing protein [Thermoanaerobaculia bacterium]|nr:PilZ domain-containing protein [Thermoanaerobaculia bacterium]
MGERRRNRRWPRQLAVRFWKQGEEGQGNRAVSTNISRTGVFVRTQLVLPSGTRMRLAIGHSGRDFTIEGVVMRALRSPAHLQAAMPSGMGVRFLTAEELLEELLPSIDFHAEERVPGGIGAPSSSERLTPPAGIHLPAAEASTAGGPQAPRLDPAPAAPTPSPSPSPAPPSAASGFDAQPITPTLSYPLRFRDPDQFRRVFDRDVKTGGLFIHTSHPAALDAVILVEVGVEGLTAPPIRLQARVVHRMEPPPGSPPGNLLAGMGVQFLDVARAVEQLRALLR